MTKNAMSTYSVDVTRVRFDSTRSFDAVKSSLLSLMGTTRLDEVSKATQAVRSAEDLERSLKPFIGESGFMLFYEVDHSKWLPLYGITRKATRLIFGNQLIAITMIRRDIESSFFVPVELLLFEDERGDGSSIIYDLPSSLMQAKANPELLAAAQALDTKLEALVSRATGVPVS
jgi:uncharacterized protein (DUF302 family)